MATTGDDFDVIVLGLGPGGEDLAEAMASAGHAVLGIDERLVGGECPYFGCIPSKMVLRAGEVLAEARRVRGLAGEAEVRPDFAPVHARIRDEATDDWNDAAAVTRFEDAGGVFLRGRARLAGRGDDGRVRVRVGEREYGGRHVVLATGTAPSLPPIPGLADLRGSGEHVPELGSADQLVWTNRDALHAETAPGSLVVLGGGAIGCELAQGFARFGTSVTLVEPGERILAPEEPEASAVLTEVLRREGLTVHLGARPASVERGGRGVRVTLADGTVLDAERLLCSTGRTPHLGDLGLDTLGLDPTVRSLDVDEHMQVLVDGTPVEGLYGVGDIAGPGPFTHVAVWQSRVLTAHLLDRDEAFGGYHGLAWATFTDPEIGRVGMSEQQARDEGLDVRTGTAQIASNSRGWIHGPGNDGFVKVIEDAGRGVLVGASVVGPAGGELIAVLTLAVHARVPVRELASMHYVFPTLHRAVLEAIRAIGRD